MAVDTACSSSLVGLHQAANSLQLREADVVLAGGVAGGAHRAPRRDAGRRRDAGPRRPCARPSTRPPTGTCAARGCGMLVLKRLADAEADGDRIWGVLLGSAVNQDGASKGLTVPSQHAQQQCITDALARAQVAPAEVDYLEAPRHGNAGGRPHRSPRGRRRLRRRASRGPPAADRVGQDELRPSGVRGGRGRRDEGRAGHEARRDPAAPELPGPEPADRNGSGCRCK